MPPFELSTAEELILRSARKRIQELTDEIAAMEDAKRYMLRRLQRAENQLSRAVSLAYNASLCDQSNELAKAILAISEEKTALRMEPRR